MNKESEGQKARERSGSASPLPVGYDLFILLLTIYALVIMTGILLPGRPTEEAILYWSDFLICLVLFADFLICLRRAPNKMAYFLRQGGWLDLIGVIPAVPGLPWTSLFRLARLNRLIRIFQNMRGDRDDGLKPSAGNRAGNLLLSMILLTFVLLTVGSLVILRFERGAPEANITTGATAFWWAFVTMTTVGYGDFVPVTHAGRVLALGLMTFGIGIFAVFTSFVASRIVLERDDQDDLVSLVREENAQIRAELAEIKEMMQKQSEDKKSDS